MAAATTGTRQRMIDSAATLLSEQGTAGTTVEAVLAHSGAPRGSVYHHFPAGRNELVLTAVRTAGERITRLIGSGDDDRSPRQALERFGAFWRHLLDSKDYRAGCPVVALTVGGVDHIPGGPELVAELLTDWKDHFTALLIAHRIPQERARRLSNLTVCAVEGAVVLARVERSCDPLDQVIAELSALI